MLVAMVNLEKLFMVLVSPRQQGASVALPKLVRGKLKRVSHTKRSKRESAVPGSRSL